MGRRSPTESLVAIYQAFLRQRTWRQPDLAREVGLGVPALRKHLLELERSDFPVVRDEENPREVFWSVPQGWFPGGVMFRADEVPELLRQFGHLPHSPTRDEWIARILRAAPAERPTKDVAEAIIPPPASDSENAYTRVVEESALERVPLHLHYFTTSRIAVEWRHVSVQRVIVGPPTRFVAACHHTDHLKWFRVDNVLAARLDQSLSFRDRPPSEVDAFIAASLDGFHGGALVACSFFVRDPEATWVAHNLPGELRSTRADGGVRFHVETAGVVRLARFVVGLGQAARPETPELAKLVRELAEGALASTEQHEAATRKANVCAVASNDSNDSDEAAE